MQTYRILLLFYVLKLELSGTQQYINLQQIYCFRELNRILHVLTGFYFHINTKALMHRCCSTL